MQLPFPMAEARGGTMRNVVSIWDDNDAESNEEEEVVNELPGSTWVASGGPRKLRGRSREAPGGPRTQTLMPS